LIHALTLDLDDTLWPIAPVIEHAEGALHAFLAEHAPQVAERWPPVAMRALRDRVAAENPQLAHDYSAQRRLSLRLALIDAKADVNLVEPCYQAFIAARHQVNLYADAEPALRRFARVRPLAALTNGNADVSRIAVGMHFRFAVSAREHGAAKPDPSIFLAACRRLSLPPAQVLHVGDDPWLDVAGAAAAGMRSCWINRTQARWPAELRAPDIEVSDLLQLADWLDTTYPHRHTA